MLDRMAWMGENGNWMSKSLKLNRILKPFFVGVILIVLFFSFLPKKAKNISYLSLESVKAVYSQGIFADPAKKARSEGPDYILVGENSLISSLPPFTVTPQVLGAIIDGYEPEEAPKGIIEYAVEQGDNFLSLSQKFNISVNTILWANGLNKNSKLQLGKKLIIPPVTGVIHGVKAGDTVSEIAKKYKAKIENIVSFNELSGESDVYVGDILIIPDGTMPSPVVKYAVNQVPLASSYFICPLSQPCNITQGLHFYNAVDFSHGKCGEPIFAAAGGKVTKVKLTDSTSRWVFGGAGSNIAIEHPNGAITTYGHVAASLVSLGDSVSQGQMIALVGGKPGTPGAGKSTGCHVHFGVINAKNPFAR